jgi:hypothetical protein
MLSGVCNITFLLIIIATTLNPTQGSPAAILVSVISSLSSYPEPPLPPPRVQSAPDKEDEASTYFGVWFRLAPGTFNRRRSPVVVSPRLPTPQITHANGSTLVHSMSGSPPGKNLCQRTSDGGSNRICASS